MSDFSSYIKVLTACVRIPFRNLAMYTNNLTLKLVPGLMGIKVGAEIQNNRFTIELTYGKNVWIVQKTVLQIYQLQLYLDRNYSVKIPLNYDNLGTTDQIQELSIFLVEVQKRTSCLDIPFIYTFFKMSQIGLSGGKVFDGVFAVRLVKPVPRMPNEKKDCRAAENPNQVFFRRKMVSFKKDSIIVMNVETHRVEKVIPMTKEVVVCGGRTLSITYYNTDIGIRSASRMLQDKIFNLIKNEFEKECYPKRFDSTFGVHLFGNVNFYVEGKDYYASVYKQIHLATNEIFIAGWWVYPILFLKRENAGRFLNTEYRLCNLLKKKASEGVRIYVLVYREIELALSIDSSFTKTILTSMHPNIQVIRHPYYGKLAVSYWSHHEKIVVVDQKVSFVGGIDLCLGRYDDSNHRIFDLHCLNKPRVCYGFRIVQCRKIYWRCKIRTLEIERFKVIYLDLALKRKNGCYTDNFILDRRMKKRLPYCIFPGQDYNNCTIKDFKCVSNETKDTINRLTTPRSPWHDSACKLTGKAAFDAARHFIYRWNFAKDNVLGCYDFLVPSYNASKSKTSCSLQIVRSASLWSCGVPVENSIEEAYVQMIESSKRYIYIENQFFVTRGSAEETGILNRIGIALVERIKRAKLENTPFKVYIILPLLPGFVADMTSPDASASKTIMKLQRDAIYTGNTSMFNVLRCHDINLFEYAVFLSLANYWYDDEKFDYSQIYVHIKTMVVDGTSAIVGSANINDRSMVGCRDSEVAVVVEGTDRVKGYLKQLLTGHLSISKSDDYLDTLFKTDRWFHLESREMFIAIKNLANNNTVIYKKYFKTFPSNDILCTDDYNYVNEKFTVYYDSRKCEIQEALLNIRGHIVFYPHRFMMNQCFFKKLSSPADYLPDKIYQ